jgi:class 3 adenylate cyclase
VQGRGADIAGIAVHVASRICDLAAPRQVLVSSTVKELAFGSGLPFVDEGRRQLQGVPDTWQLFDATASTPPAG